jgi:preprotein translocase subunit YajC
MNSFNLSLFLAQATAAGAPPNFLVQLAPLFFIGIIFYFLLIRPQQKQKKAHQALLAAVKTGDKVVTSCGIHGIVANVKEQTVLLKVADNVKIEIDKAAITNIEKENDSK